MMKSDISQVVCLALTTFFFLSCVVSLTEGKCQGNWAIHACWGGNGKRSDPSMDEGPNPSLLRQLLLRQGPVFTPPALEVNLEDLSPAEPEELVSPFNSEFPEYPRANALSKGGQAHSTAENVENFAKESNSLP